eukprot:gene5975-6422_t
MRFQFILMVIFVLYDFYQIDAYKLQSSMSIRRKNDLSLYCSTFDKNKLKKVAAASIATFFIPAYFISSSFALESSPPGISAPAIVNSINTQTSSQFTLPIIPSDTSDKNSLKPIKVATDPTSTTKKKTSDQSTLSTTSSLAKKPRQSQWDLLRQKRTAAIKDLQQKGFIQIDTDNDSGKQVIFFPWIPDQKIPYKQLTAKQRLINEVSAGAFGEIAKDSLLHWVDTLKTRKQAEKKKLLLQQEEENGSNVTITTSDSAQITFPTTVNTKNRIDNAVISLANSESSENQESNIIIRKLLDFKSLYAGFPIVALASIPQGGSFFLLKKGILELQSTYFPQFGNNNVIISMLSISAGVMAYWFFRTPSELIKTQIQTKQEQSVLSFFNKLLSSPAPLPSSTAASSPHNPTFALDTSSPDDQTVMTIQEKLSKIINLWKYYPVMLSLDIPFQIINFILFGIVNDYLQTEHIPQTIWIRLLVGIGCGTTAAFLTCPLDVGKTRILARDKERQKKLEAMNEEEKREEAMKGGLDESNMLSEIINIFQSEGLSSLFLGLRQRLVYTGLANGIRLAAYGTSRMDLMMRKLDEL